MDTQRTPDEITALRALVWRSMQSPELKDPAGTWDREGQEFTRLMNIARVLSWALGRDVQPEDTPEARAAFAWLTGGPPPVDQDGFTPRYRRRVA